MFNRYSLFIAALLLAAVFWLLRSGDADRILVQLEQIRLQAGISAPESGIEQLTKATAIADLFGTETVFDLTSAGYGITRVTTRQDLVRHIMTIRSRLSSLELALEDAEVHVDGDTARVEATGSALGSRTGQPGQFLEIHTGTITLVKENGDWLVTGAVHLRDERRPEP
jgi:hypothetical protein